MVSRGHYSEKDAAELIAKLARALQQCHESGIVHRYVACGRGAVRRCITSVVSQPSTPSLWSPCFDLAYCGIHACRDLKPENVLYKSKADDAEPVLADFGLSLLRDRADVHSGIIGTPGYLSPEIITSKKYTEAADVWALGVLAYILLCGYPPFYSDKRIPAENHAELYGQIRAGAYAFHEDAWAPISESARALIAGMLTVDEDKRAGLAQVLAHPWVTSNVHVAHLPRTIDNLRQFNARRKIRAAAMAVRLGAVGARRKVQSLLGETRLTSEQLAALSTAFHNVAGSGGAVGKAQFVTVMSSVGLTELPLDRLFEAFDADGSADIDYRELIVGLASLHGAEADDESLRMCFRVYDVDGDGAITLPELVRLLQVLHAHDDASPGSSTPLASALASPGVGGAGAAPAAPAAAASGTFSLTALETDEASVGALEQLFKRIDSNADGKRECADARGPGVLAGLRRLCPRVVPAGMSVRAG